MSSIVGFLHTGATAPESTTASMRPEDDEVEAYFAIRDSHIDDKDYSHADDEWREQTTRV